MPSTDPAPRTRSRSASGQYDRRTLIASAALLAIVISVGIIVVAANADSGPRRDTQGQAQDGSEKPHIIERPNSGHAPTDAGDRGGWEQLTVFGLIAASMLGIGVVIFRGGRRARAGRDAWKAAAATGKDGAVPRDPVRPGPRSDP